MERKNNHQEVGLIVGFILGFSTFLAHEYLKEDSNRKKVKKDIKKLKKHVTPYVLELREKIEKSDKLQEALVDIDKKLGTNLYSYLLEDLEELEENKESKSKSKKKERKFFKLG